MSTRKCDQCFHGDVCLYGIAHSESVTHAEAYGAGLPILTCNHFKNKGLIAELPCKVGDTVYWMWTDGAGDCEPPIFEDTVYEIYITKNGIALSEGPYSGKLGMIGIHPPRAVFLTREAAEAALKGESRV